MLGQWALTPEPMGCARPVFLTGMKRVRPVKNWGGAATDWDFDHETRRYLARDRRSRGGERFVRVRAGEKIRPRSHHVQPLQTPHRRWARALARYRKRVENSERDRREPGIVYR